MKIGLNKQFMLENLMVKKETNFVYSLYFAFTGHEINLLTDSGGSLGFHKVVCKNVV